MERQLSLLLTVFCLAPAWAFTTENCTHQNLQSALTGFQACVDQVVTIDICSSFSQLDTCFPRYFSSCLSRSAVEEITLNAKAVLRKAMEMILSDHQQQYGGFSSGSLFDICDNIPSHEDSVKANSRKLPIK